MGLREQIATIAVGLLGFDCRNHPKDEEDHSIGCFPETGFDCSGFVRYVLSFAGIHVPREIRHASEFFDSFGVFVQRYRPGDLIFFSKTGRAPRHIGVVINEGEYIHSPGKNGTKVAVAQIKREVLTLKSDDQIYLENPIGFKSPVTSNGRWKKII